MAGRIPVAGVAEDEPDGPRQGVDQPWRGLVVGGVGRGQVCRQRDPDGGDGGGQVELPAVDSAEMQGPRCTAPAVPARLGPVGLGVDEEDQQRALRYRGRASMVRLGTLMVGTCDPAGLASGGAADL
jgi:hypothetical protein